MRRLVALAAAYVMVAGCAIPTDPDETLERVRGGALRVGMTEADPWARRDGERRAGVEVGLIARFAGELGARVKWTDGSEEELFEGLHAGSLDVVIGGITAKSPWSETAAFTRPYATVRSASGKPEEHVLATRLGENDFLTELDFFLQRREAEIDRDLEQAGERLARLERSGAS
jgi:ABC-type amino acid transport substrate-binding protein